MKYKHATSNSARLHSISASLLCRLEVPREVRVRVDVAGQSEVLLFSQIKSEQMLLLSNPALPLVCALSLQEPSLQLVWTARSFAESKAFSITVGGEQAELQLSFKGSNAQPSAHAERTPVHRAKPKPHFQSDSLQERHHRQSLARDFQQRTPTQPTNVLANAPKNDSQKCLGRKLQSVVGSAPRVPPKRQTPRNTASGGAQSGWQRSSEQNCSLGRPTAGGKSIPAPLWSIPQLEAEEGRRPERPHPFGSSSLNRREDEARRLWPETLPLRREEADGHFGFSQQDSN